MRTERWMDLFEGTRSPEMVRCKVCGELIHTLNKMEHAQKHIVDKRVETVVITGPNVWGLPIGTVKKIEIPIYGD